MPIYTRGIKLMRHILSVGIVFVLFIAFGTATAQIDLPAPPQQDPTPSGDDTLDSLRDLLQSGGGGSEGSGAGFGGTQQQQPTQPPPAPTSQPAPSASSLQNHDMGWEIAISELTALGVIPDGGSLVFQEDRVFANAAGSGYVDLASNSPFADIVMAGQINFNSTSPELETCGLTSAMTGTPQRLNDFLIVGTTNQGFAYLLDTQLPDDQGILTYGPVGYDSADPHHFLYLLIDGEVTVYLDGELQVESFPVTDRSGFYGLGMVSDPASVTNCEALNVWVYRVSSGSQACEVIAGSTVNRRSGPGTNFAIAGQLNSGSITEAVAQTTGSDGFTWYELEDGSFIREDIIRTQGACAGLPQS